MPTWDSLWLNANLACMHARAEAPCGIIQHGAIAVKDSRIAWLGKQEDLPTDYQAKITYDADGAWILPDLIDCHTHLIYAGNRSKEFAARLRGATYAEIAQQGGGIMSTVRATRAASEEQLIEAALPRLTAIMREGVTTIEIKSGYGLNIEVEARILRVARRLQDILPIRIKNTFLGAHALPPEFTGRSDQYIDFICDQMLPTLAQEGLVDAVDVFCEKIGFSLSQTEQVLRTAGKLGIPTKLHAEQLSYVGGAALLAKLGGLSADHLEYLSVGDTDILAKHQTVAVLLPGAYYFLRETMCPPIAALRSAKVAMAVATDHNPGTSPMTSLPLAANMACVLFGLTAEEALLGMTMNAAKALGLQEQVGQLAVGYSADLTFWDIDHPIELVSTIGLHRPSMTVFQGLIRHSPS